MRDDDLPKLTDPDFWTARGCVMLGGAFSYTQRDVRCAFRNYYTPDSPHWNYGFRVCVAARQD